MAFKVLIPQDITDPGKDYLKEHGCVGHRLRTPTP